ERSAKHYGENLAQSLQRLLARRLRRRAFHRQHPPPARPRRFPRPAHPRKNLARHNWDWPAALLLVFLANFLYAIFCQWMLSSAVAQIRIKNVLQMNEAIRKLP